MVFSDACLGLPSGCVEFAEWALKLSCILPASHLFPGTLQLSRSFALVQLFRSLGLCSCDLAALFVNCAVDNSWVIYTYLGNPALYQVVYWLLRTATYWGVALCLISWVAQPCVLLHLAGRWEDIRFLCTRALITH